MVFNLSTSARLPHAVIGFVLNVLVLHAAHASEILDAIKDRGMLRCGVSQGLVGFSSIDDKGDWFGLDVDYCRAVSAAIFDDPNAVQFIPLSAKERFTALQSGEIDVLSRNTTWTMTRDTTLGVDFLGVMYYDGQGLMVPKALKIKGVQDLDGAMVCTNAGTTTELTLADFFRANQLNFQLISFEKADEVVAAYAAGRCDVYTTDASALAAQKLRLPKADEHEILDITLSKEPLGPIVRHGDDNWTDLARWVLYVLINAEELGVSSENVDSICDEGCAPAVSRLTGNTGDFGRMIGLDASWSRQVIRHVGNYGEIFERNLGQDSPLKIPRGLNGLWRDGGIHYAPPLR